MHVGVGVPIDAVAVNVGPSYAQPGGGCTPGVQVGVRVGDTVQAQVFVGVAVVANAPARPAMISATTMARCPMPSRTVI